MLNFLKKLYEQRLKNITVILLDDSRPGEDESYQFRPGRLFSFLGLMSFLLAIFVALIFMLTPLGSLLYNTEDKEIRDQVESVTQRVIALQDSLNVRDNQLSEMKRVIRLSVDTTLAMDERFSAMFEEGNDNNDFLSIRFDPQSTSERVGTTGILMSNVFKSAPDFPSNFPVEGTLTRDYEPEEFHFGMDIATKKDAVITSIGDGTVINASWTINDGYVITIQHAGGIVSQYKHCSSLTKKNGDVVLKGDIIGVTGDVGISSSGPHLHFEIWKDGLPQDPAIYLIQ
jgi:murein DD-endopeptidase MepM/ murein hydrolase activator NlpD